MPDNDRLIKKIFKRRECELKFRIENQTKTFKKLYHNYKSIVKGTCAIEI